MPITKCKLWCTGFNHDGTANVYVSDVDDMSEHGWVKLRDLEIPYDEPKRPEIVAAQVIVLDKKIEKAYLDCEEKVAGLKKERAKLLAIDA
jgi:hypothetical protein